MTEEGTQAETPKNKPRAKPAPSGKEKALRDYLNDLRQTGKALCRAISANIERDVIEALELAAAPSGKGGRKKHKKSDLARAVSILERLSIKPEKGKRGDIKKIEKALRGVKEALSADKNG